MKKLFIKTKQLAAILISCSMFITPVYAATLKIGSTGSQVVKLQTALKQLGHFNYDSITGYYGTITENAVKSFQENQGLNIDGIATDELLNLLGIYENDEYNILGDADWFSKVQYIFPRGGVATVTDIKTGKSFNLQRTFGSNHADVEPLTKEDSEIIKSIWGGWTWERRAVIVNSDNNIIAGSMTAVPHAGVDNAPVLSVVNNRSAGYGRGQNFDAIKGNGVDGHMDIHFLNSRTHGTNTIQKQHQDMIKMASEYINKNY